MGIGDWGLGIGDWAQSPIPNPQSPIPNPQITDELKTMRFSQIRSEMAPSTSTAGESNPFMINCEHMTKRPPRSKEDHEEEIIPATANSGTSLHFDTSPPVSYSAIKALRNPFHDYWMSKLHSVDDHWEAVFNYPQKLDSFTIEWRYPPKRFKIWFKIDESETYLPLTELIEKYKDVEDDKNNDKNNTSKSDAFIFNKPIFAKRIRIAMNTPLQQEAFAIDFVRFYEKRTTMLIRNQNFTPGTQLCMLVNSANPKENDRVEFMDCTKCIQIGDNRELWVSYTDKTIRHLKSSLCLGYDNKFDVVLRKCIESDPVYRIFVNSDSTLSFQSEKDRIISMKTDKELGINYVNKMTDITATSTADNVLYSVNNIKELAEGFWMSKPGDTKVTVTVNFGKTKTGNEVKTVDVIQISWVSQPKAYSVYKWRENSARELLRRFTDLPRGAGLGVIEVANGQFSSVIIEATELNMDSNMNLSCSISRIMITSKSFLTNLVTRPNAAAGGFTFDFEVQFNQDVAFTKDFNQALDKFSIAAEKMNSLYSKMNDDSTMMEKLKDKAQKDKLKLDIAGKYISENATDKLQDFNTNALEEKPSPVLVDLAKKYCPLSEVNALTENDSGSPKLGTQKAPAKDCLHIRLASPNANSGFNWIKPECAEKPIRVYCDFNLEGSALDIFIESNDDPEPDPDLSSVNPENELDIREVCAKRGLEPIEIKSGEMLNRIGLILKSNGYKLKDGKVIPIGVDYGCNKEKCSDNFNSFNKVSTIPINTFAKAVSLSPSNKPNFVGYAESSLTALGTGDGDKNKQGLILFKFPATGSKLAGIICSTNHSAETHKDANILKLTCDMNVSNNGEMFQTNREILVQCPEQCNLGIGEIYGNKRYHGSSVICKSAIHSTMLLAEGGKVYINVLPAKDDGYDTYDENGISSKQKKADAEPSFIFTKYTPECPKDTISQMRKNHPKNDKVEDKSFSDKNFDKNIQNSSFLESNMEVNEDPMPIENQFRFRSNNDNTSDNSNLNIDAYNDRPIYNRRVENENLSQNNNQLLNSPNTINKNIQMANLQSNNLPINQEAVKQNTEINNLVTKSTQNVNTGVYNNTNSETVQNTKSTIKVIPNNSNVQQQSIQENKNNNIQNISNNSNIVKENSANNFNNNNQTNVNQNNLNLNSNVQNNTFKNDNVNQNFKNFSNNQNNNSYQNNNINQNVNNINTPKGMLIDHIEHVAYKDASTQDYQQIVASLNNNLDQNSKNNLVKAQNEVLLPDDVEHVKYRDTPNPSKMNNKIPMSKIPNIKSQRIPIQKMMNKISDKENSFSFENLNILNDIELQKLGMSKNKIKQLRTRQYLKKNGMLKDEIDLDIDGKIIGTNNANNFTNMSFKEKDDSELNNEFKNESDKLRFAEAKAGINPNQVVRQAAVEAIQKSLRKKIDNGMMNLFGLENREHGEWGQDSVSLNGALSGDAVMAAEALGLGDAARQGYLGGSALDDENHRNFNIGIGPNGLLTLGGPGKSGQLWGERGQNFGGGPNMEVQNGGHTSMVGKVGDPSLNASYRMMGGAYDAAKRAASSLGNPNAGALGSVNSASHSEYTDIASGAGRLGVGSGNYPGLSDSSYHGAMGAGKGAIDLYATPGHYQYGGSHHAAGGGNGGGGAYSMGSAYGYGKGGISAFVSIKF
jgi:hypothetical protein